MHITHGEHVEKELNLLITGRDTQRVKDEGERAQEAIAKGTAEKMWGSYWEMDYGLRWDHARECWVEGYCHRYDGSRFGVGSGRPVDAA